MFYLSVCNSRVDNLFLQHKPFVVIIQPFQVLVKYNATEFSACQYLVAGMGFFMAQAGA
jgi:hypothetical protein